MNFIIKKKGFTMLSVAKQEKLKAHAILALITFLVTVMMIACSGCRTIEAAAKDLAGIANATADVLHSQVEKAEKRDANRDAKYLMLYNSEQSAQAKLQ